MTDSDSDFVIPFDRLPPKFAESIEHPPARPVSAQPAATIVLLRDAEDGMEVLLMRRSRSSGFVPGAYVFPGGRVDASDATRDLIERVDDLSEGSAATRLELEDASPPAIAYYLAALREAFEETGILVAHAADGSAPETAAESADVDALRGELMEDRVSFADVLDRLGCRIDGASIEYLAHWITPKPEPRRYDTRFFAAKVRQGATPIVDPREMTDAVWITPRGALTRHERGDLPMVFPTIMTLKQLSAHASTSEALADLRRRAVRTIMPTLVITPTGVAMDLDGGEGPDPDPGEVVS